MATPMPGEPAWFIGVPDSNGEYLVCDSIWRRRWIAEWLGGEGKRTGKWFLQGRPYCEADGVICWRPLPRVPDLNNHSEV